MESGMYLRFPVARGSRTFSGQPSYISASIAPGRPSEGSVLLPRGQPREISSCSHSSCAPSSVIPSKQFLSDQGGGFIKPCGLLILMKARLGLGFGLGLVGLDRGPRSAKSTMGRCRLTVSSNRGDSSSEDAHYYHNPRGTPADNSRQRPSESLICRLSAEMPDFGQQLSNQVCGKTCRLIGRRRGHVYSHHGRQW